MTIKTIISPNVIFTFIHEVIGIVIFICVFSQTASAQASQPAASSEYTTHKVNTMQVEEDSPWEFGIAAGIGKRDNILVSSDDIDINAFVHIAYFGDNFFFDNGDIGYYLSDNNHWNINLIAGPNSERQFFEKFNRLGVEFASNSTSLDSVGVIIEDDDVVPVKPATRDQTFDLGFEVIGDGEWGNLHLQLNAEITNKHHGFEVWSGYSYQFNFGDLTITPSLGLTYKSDNWTNYFYGVRENEAILATDGTSYIRAPYQAGSSLNHYYKIMMNYPISAQLKLVAILENEQLDKIISDSPIVDKTNMATQFIGLFYEF